VHVVGTPESPQLVLCSPGSISVLPFTPEALAWALPPGQPPHAPLSAEPELADWAAQQLGQPVQAWPRKQRWALAARPRWDLAQGLLMRQRGPRSPLQWLQAPRWRGARWATLGLVGVNLLGLNGLAGAQRMQAQARQAQMQQVLQQTFPQAAPVDDPLPQMERELERLRQAGTKPLAGDLGTMLGVVLAALPDGRVPEALDHAPGRLRLKGLTLSAPELQSLAARLGPQGYRVSSPEGDLLLQVGP
jgi:general secretion pathway protein L